MSKSSETLIQCPQCKNSIALTESLAAPFIEKAQRDFDVALRARDTELEARQALLSKELDAVASDRRLLEQRISARVIERLESERKAIEEEAAANARLSFSTELSERDRRVTALESALRTTGDKLAASQNSELELEKQRRGLEAQIAEQDLVVERRVHDAMAPLRLELAKQADERSQLSVRERDMIIEQLRTQIDDLKQRVDQGSQQLQGEVQEILLEELLSTHFRFDRIEPIAKGESGADVIQNVVGSTGEPAGSILWESKRTKHWNDQWLVKMRADQRRIGADVAVLVTRALPKGITTFDFIDGVWVVSRSLVPPVATMLRHAILRVASAHATAEGQQTKAELLYRYLTGKAFAGRLTALAEAFEGIRADLDAERKLLMRQWARREQHIRSVENTLMGFVGDVEGIAGQDLKALDALSLRALPADSAPASLRQPA
jgi:hypothetical protein